MLHFTGLANYDLQKMNRKGSVMKILIVLLIAIASSIYGNTLVASNLLQDDYLNAELESTTVTRKKKCKKYCSIIANLLRVCNEANIKRLNVQSLAVNNTEITTNGITEYAYIYIDGNQGLNPNDDITFTDNGIVSSGISHVPGATTITVINGGIYKITYTVTGFKGDPTSYVFGIVLNNTVILESEYFSNAYTTTGTSFGNITGQLLLEIPNNSTISLRNLSGTVQLQGGPAVTASIILEKIA